VAFGVQVDPPEVLTVAADGGRVRLSVDVEDVVEIRPGDRVVVIRLRRSEPQRRSRELIEEIAQALDDSRSGRAM
jgi:hypothetical protein